MAIAIRAISVVRGKQEVLLKLRPRDTNFFRLTKNKKRIALERRKNNERY